MRLDPSQLRDRVRQRHNLPDMPDGPDFERGNRSQRRRRRFSSRSGRRPMGLGKSTAAAAATETLTVTLDQPIHDAVLLISDPDAKVTEIEVVRDGQTVYLGTNFPAGGIRVQKDGVDPWGENGSGLYLGTIQNKIVVKMTFSAAASAWAYLVGKFDASDGIDVGDHYGDGE